MNKYAVVLSLAGVAVIVDQISKWYIRQHFALYESLSVIDSFFRITHARNAGGAFGLLNQGARAWRLPFFLMASCVAIVVLLMFVRRVQPGQWWLLVALGSILGGALGNLIDRMTSGEVTDFLDVYWRDYHWPTFNVADSCITVGMAILVVYSLVVRDEPPAGQR
ncbi:MAG: lipoprotein signal peptidase [Deltaproteobacteria bacterium]|nr:lipoprotein signal peptidase [Deltaproteobacteria bacterium]